MSLPQLHDNDAKIIKNAGAVITHPFGGITRSVMIAIYNLGADEVFVVGHHDCGMTKVDSASTLTKMVDKGIARHTLVTMQYSGIDVSSWLSGFDSVEDSVCNSVDIIRNHPLTPQEVPVHGLIIDPNTGLLDLVVDGYKEMPVLTGGMPYAHTEWLASIPGPTTMPPAGAAAGAITGSDGDDVTLEQRHEDAIARAAIRARSASSCDGDDAGAEPPLEPAGEAAAAAEARMLADAKARAAGKAAAAAAPQSPSGGGSFASLGISVASSSLDRTAERAAAALAVAAVPAGAPQPGPGGTIGRRERPRAPMSAIFSVGIN
jgi:carbonic anhydrase